MGLKQKKLNLGCGKDYRPGWVNVDAVAAVRPDVVHDLAEPLPFADQTFSLVLAQDILEHFTKEMVVEVIREIARVLIVGGQLEVRVPNLNDIIERFADDEATRNEFIYGTTFETGIFGAHKVGFTPVGLVAMMEQVNLQLIGINRVETNFVARFKKVLPNKKVRQLVYLNQTLGLGGAEVFMTDLLVGLRNKGWQVKIFTNFLPFASMLKKQHLAVELVPTVVDIIGDWKGLVKGIFLWPKLLLNYWQIVSKNTGADLFLMSGFVEKILGSPIVKWYQRPSVWIEFGPMETIFAKFGRFPKVLYFLVKSLPERVVTSSYHSRQSLTSVARISLAKLRVLVCGRDLPAHSIKSQPLNRIVCVSRLEPGKGQDLLLKAFALLASKHPTTKLQIVGEGDFLPILKQLAVRLKITERVEFLGRVDDALVTLSQAQVVVFPSVWALEGFGLVMIEAMSLAKAVVAFNRGPGNEIIEHEQAGLLAIDGDVSDLAKQIDRLLVDQKLAHQLGKKAQQIFREKYQIEAVVKNYEQVFLEAMADHKAKTVLNQK